MLRMESFALHSAYVNQANGLVLRAKFLNINFRVFPLFKNLFYATIRKQISIWGRPVSTARMVRWERAEDEQTSLIRAQNNNCRKFFRPRCLISGDGLPCDRRFTRIVCHNNGWWSVAAVLCNLPRD